MQRWYVQDDSGNPVTGPSPSFVVYRSLALADRSQPLIVELGAGWYSFTETSGDSGAGTAWVVDNGAGHEPRYSFGSIYDDTHPFDVLLFTDGSGALWSGAAATISTYADGSGNRTPPALSEVASAYLFVLLPTSADVTAITHYRVDAPAGAIPPSYTGTFEPDAGGGGSGDVTPPVVALISPAEGVAGTTDPLILEVTDDHALGLVVVTASFPGFDEVMFNSVGFGQKYANGSTLMTAISGGFRFQFLRTGGWPAGQLRVRVEAVDTSGNEA